PPANVTPPDSNALSTVALPLLQHAVLPPATHLPLPGVAPPLDRDAAQPDLQPDLFARVVVGLLVAIGACGGRPARSRRLLAGAAAFAVASVLAAFARSAEMLIAMRALLGVAGATLAPSTLSLIRNMFHDDHERQFAIGVWIAAFSVGGAVGPLVGGVLLQWF